MDNIAGNLSWRELIDGAANDMVLVICADCGKVDFNFDSSRFEDLWVANARELEDLWRVDCTTADYDLAVGFDDMLLAIVDEFDTCGS